jgi:hypothetical protein
MELNVIEDADSHSARPFPPAAVLDVCPTRKILGHPFPTISELMYQVIQLVIFFLCPGAVNPAFIVKSIFSIRSQSWNNDLKIVGFVG